jgi:hypothetical protein
MKCRSRLTLGLIFLGWSLLISPAAASELKAALLSAEQVSAEKLRDLMAEGYNAAALLLSESNAPAQLAAAREIQKAKLTLYYWIEIARNSVLADAHPEWIASIQTHPEYRRFFPQLAQPRTNEVVKNYPWVPVLYEQTFPVHLERVRQLLATKPVPAGIFLNDLQGAPSACGCGHPLCRWTTDYGPLKTATRLPNDSAAKFVAAVRALAPQANIIPVWATECEENDAQTLCGGVGCFKGTCWREFTAQLKPVSDASPTIGALLLYKTFKRDSPEYHPPAGWIRDALNLFSKMPLRYQTTGVPTSRIVPVLQGWDVNPQQIAEQLREVGKAGAAGTVVAFTPIDQGWEPRIFDRVSGRFVTR